MCTLPLTAAQIERYVYTKHNAIQHNYTHALLVAHVASSVPIFELS